MVESHNRCGGPILSGDRNSNGWQEFIARGPLHRRWQARRRERASLTHARVPRRNLRATSGSVLAEDASMRSRLRPDRLFAVILPVTTVGAMGDCRTYDLVVGLHGRG